MNYFYVKNKENVEKYELSYNKEEVLNLRQKLIDNCSEISNGEIITSNNNIEKYMQGCEIRNISKGIHLSENTLKYHYQLYKYPNVVNIIDKILNGDIQAFINLNIELNALKKEDKKENNKSELEIQKILNEIDKINSLDIDRKIDKLLLLKEVQEKSKLNVNQKSVLYYYDEIINLFKTNLIDSKEYNKFLDSLVFDNEKLVLTKNKF